jgi:hypothetical protein
MGKLKGADRSDPLTQPVVTVGPHNERVVLTPFHPAHTQGDEVEGFGGASATTKVEPPQGRLKIITPLISIVIK